MNFISRFYNQKVEDICVRVVYFFNTIDTYFLLAGAASFLMVLPKEVNVVALVLAAGCVIAAAKKADFYPAFGLFAVPVMVTFTIALNIALPLIAKILLANIVFFIIIQFSFMGLPEAIVARDIRVPFVKIFNSLFTVAPTTVSFSMSIFFSFYLSFFMAGASVCQEAGDYAWLGAAVTVLLIGAVITRRMLPKNNFSRLHMPVIKGKPIFKRVVVLNIDGVRKDIFDSLRLPAIDRLIREGTSHARGLETVYRALTNPAFASILTGTIPKIHGIRNNNLGQTIKTEGLPDVVPSIAYGSMHVKHFCKKYWKTRIVSLPRHSVYRSDDLMVEQLKEDMLIEGKIRLFVADFSEADFLAHAYGSKSRQYKNALGRVDKRIGNFIDWMQENGILDDTGVIVCSDHGIAGIDHSYLIARSEKFVPFLIYGKGVKKGFKMKEPGKIMDICCTISYLLGIRYPGNCRGRVFTEAFQNC